MKKYYLFFALLIAGCTSSAFVPYSNISYPAHKTATFVKDTTAIPYYYFYLGDYYLDSKSVLYSRNDLIDMLLDEANYYGADLISGVQFSTTAELENYQGTYYTGETKKTSCSFIRYLRNESGEPIKRK